MNFVRSKRRSVERRAGAAPHPRAVTPFVLALLDDARGSRRVIGSAREGIGFEGAHPVASGHEELVANTLADARAEQLPHSGTAEHSHRPGPRVPEVRVADDADAERVRCPDAEGRSNDAVVLDHPRSERTPELQMRALADQVQIELAESRREGVRILLLPLPLVVAEPDPVAGEIDHRKVDLEQAVTVAPPHRGDAVHPRDACRRRLRVKRADQCRRAVGMRPQQRVRVAQPACQKLLERDVEVDDGARVGSHSDTAPRSRNRSGISTQVGRCPIS